MVYELNNTIIDKKSSLKHTYLIHTEINPPENNHVYHIVNPENPCLESIIIFVGDVTNVIYYNPLIGTKKKTTTEASSVLCMHSMPYCFVSIQALPINIDKKKLPPILVYFYQRPQKLYFQETYSIDVNKLPKIRPTKFIRSPMRKRSRALQYQRWAGSIPITYGQYPIFLDRKRPSFEALTAIFQSFITFNTPKKLIFQKENSDNFCHIRAFFVSEFLRRVYRITTELAYKKWRASDWDPFSDVRRWEFHCVVKVGSWIFDPWEASRKNWMSLVKWFHKKDEPVPREIMFTNSMVFSDCVWGRKADGIGFMESSKIPMLYVRTFQFMCSEAIPLHMEAPLVGAEKEAGMYLRYRGFFSASKTMPSNSILGGAINSTPVFFQDSLEYLSPKC